MLLIDAYNVLHADPPADLAGLGEPGLCLLLDRSGWAQRGRAIVAVCDGLPKPHSLEPGRLEAVHLRFSGAAQSADDVIVALLESDSAPRRITVVTDDRAIRSAAKRRGAKTLASEAFLAQLARQTIRKAARPSHGRGKPGTPRGKPGEGSLGPWATEAWLRAFGVDPEAAGLEARRVSPTAPPDPPKPARQPAAHPSAPKPVRKLATRLEDELVASAEAALTPAKPGETRGAIPGAEANPLESLDLVHLEQLFREHRLDEALTRIDAALHGADLNPPRPRG